LDIRALFVQQHFCCSSSGAAALCVSGKKDVPHIIACCTISFNLKAMMHVAHGMASYSGTVEYSNSTPRENAAGVWMHFALGQYGAESLAC
jgi:hypothetical protein